MTSQFSSFHGVYDAKDYAQLSSEFAQFETSNVSVRAFRRDRTLISGPGASFGGFTFNQELVTFPSLEPMAEALRTFVSVLAEQEDVDSFMMRLGADSYYPATFYRTLQSACLIENWQWNGEVTFVVSRDEFSPRSSVERNVRKASRAGLRLEKIAPQACYDLLRNVKDAKGYQFSYTQERFVQQLECFPADFQCFGVLTETDELIASSIEVGQPSWSLLLNWDQTEQGRTLCATDFLLYQRMRALFEQGAKFVDLGTITLSRQINWGLTRHKQNFGGHCEVRNSFTYQLSK